MDRIIFCIFLKEDLDVYQHLFPKYFPSAEILEQESSQQENDDNTPNSDEDNDNNHINKEEGQPQFTQGMLLDNSCRRPSSVLSIGANKKMMTTLQFQMKTMTTTTLTRRKDNHNLHKVCCLTIVVEGLAQY